jgi:drug/metabolite transporter (DMT)-like permease
MNWLVLSFLDLFLVITYSLLYKYINTKIDNDSVLRLQSSLIIFICIGIIGTILLSIFKLYHKNTISNIQTTSIPIVPIIVVSSIIVMTHIIRLITYGTAPNPGIPMTILSLSGIFVYLLSSYFYKTQISFIKIIGIILSVIGISVVIIN